MFNSCRARFIIRFPRRFCAKLDGCKFFGHPRILPAACNNPTNIFNKKKNYYSSVVSANLNTSSQSYLLNSVETIRDFLEVLKHVNNFQNEDLVKAVETLEKLLYKNVCDKYPWAHTDSKTMLCVQANISNDCRQLFSDVIKTDIVNNLFEQITSKVAIFTSHEITALARDLVRIQVNPTEDVMIAVLNRCIELITTCPTFATTLDSLYFLSIAANHLGRPGFYLNGLIVRNISLNFDQISITPNSYNSLGRILANVGYFCSPEFIRNVILKFSQGPKLIFSDNELENVDVKSTLNFLETFSRFAKAEKLTNTKCLTPLLRHIESSMDKLSLHHLSKVVIYLKLTKFQHADLLQKIEYRANNSTNLTPADIVSILTIFDSVFCSKEVTRKVERLLIDNIQNFDSLLLSQLSRQNHLKSLANPHLITLYSNQVLKCLPDLGNSLTCLQHVVNFLPKLRHYPVELDSKLSMYCLQLLQNGLPIENSQIFCKYLLRCSINSGCISPILTEKLISQVPQFSAEGLLNINDEIKKLRSSCKYSHDVVSLDKIVRSSLLQKLLTVTNVRDLNFILSRSGTSLVLKNSGEVCVSFAELYTRFLQQLTVFDVRLTSSQIVEFKLYVPDVLQVLVNLVLTSEMKLINLPIVVNLLEALATVNYVPVGVDALENIFVSLISSDEVRDFVCGLYWLSVLGSFSEPLLLKLFEVNFLKKFDKYCEENRLISNKLQRMLCDLNRSVVLQLPHLNIPWFHEDYCRNKLITLYTGRRYSDLWKKEVKQQIVSIFEDKNLKLDESFHSEYYHNLDFIIYLDDKNQVISNLASEISSKIAVIILTPRDFCSNTRQMLGRIANKLTELEILEYKVVPLPYFELDSMHLGDQSTLKFYLMQKIFGSESLT